MNDLAKQLLTWAIIAIVLVSIFNHYANVGTVQDSIAYSDFLADVRNGQVVEVHIQSTPSGVGITGNTIDAGGNAIVVGFATAPVISGNVVCGEEVSIFVMDGASPEIGGNEVCEDVQAG